MNTNGLCAVLSAAATWRTTRSASWREEPSRTSGCWRGCKFSHIQPKYSHPELFPVRVAGILLTPWNKKPGRPGSWCSGAEKPRRLAASHYWLTPRWIEMHSTLLFVKNIKNQQSVLSDAAMTLWFELMSHKVRIRIHKRFLVHSHQTHFARQPHLSDLARRDLKRLEHLMHPACLRNMPAPENNG